MYRDDPLDNEAELREVVGDDPVDVLDAADIDLDVDRTPLEVALDVLRVLQGWADDSTVGQWFTTEQRRLDGRTPIDALSSGAFEEVEDAARAWAAARG